MIARPIAHRGLHDRARGVIENSIGAARAAIAAGYVIECDVQRTSDGHLVVFHDDRLERLTSSAGRVCDFTAKELSSLALRDTNEMIPRFADFLAAIDGKTPLVVELKSDFDGDLTAARGAAKLLAHYDGPAVLESFDPAPMAFLRANAEALGVAHVPLGIVAQARYDEDEWTNLTPAQRVELTHFLHYPRTRPNFLSWNMADLPHAIPLLAREGLEIPVTAWTVRSREEANHARQWADQIVFEGFAP